MAGPVEQVVRWLRPPPKRAAEAVIEWLGVGAFAAAVVGLVGLVLSVHRQRLDLVGVVALGCAVAAPALVLLAAGLADRLERARRVARWVLLPIGVGVVWGASEALGVNATRSVGKLAVVSVVVALVSTWAWATLGRADVRATFQADRPRSALGVILELTLPLYGVFAAATVASAFAITAGGVASFGLRGEGPLLVGAFVSGGVTTVGAVVAWRLWRGPEADVDLVTPEAWARILALHQEGVDDIADALTKEGFAPPGRRWTAEVVIRVLITAGALEEKDDDEDDER